MFKNLSVLCLFFVFTVGALAQEESNLAAWVCPEGHQGESLDIINWADYIAADTILNFELACGVTVHYQEYSDEYFMYDTLRLGNPGYDVVIASSTMVAMLGEENLLLPLDHSLIPNESYLNTGFLSQNYDPENRYSLPYMWGSTGVVYRKSAFPDGISSWDTVWNYDDAVVWLDDKRAVLGIGLLNLGYSPNSGNASEILAARDYLGEKGQNLLGIYAYGDIAELILMQESDLAISYNGTLSTLIMLCSCDDFGYTIPNEGSNIFLDNMVMPVDADNTSLAMTFMDYILHPQVNAAISNLGYGSTNQFALENGLVDTLFLEATGFNPGETILERMFYVEPLDNDTATFYDVAWNDLLQFYGSE